MPLFWGGPYMFVWWGYLLHWVCYDWLQEPHRPHVWEWPPLLPPVHAGERTGLQNRNGGYCFLAQVICQGTVMLRDINTTLMMQLMLCDLSNWNFYSVIAITYIWPLVRKKSWILCYSVWSKAAHQLPQCKWYILMFFLQDTISYDTMPHASFQFISVPLCSVRYWELQISLG